LGTVRVVPKLGVFGEGVQFIELADGIVVVKAASSAVRGTA